MGGGGVDTEIYAHTNPDLRHELVTCPGEDLQCNSCPPEVRQLGRTITRWRIEMAMWHQADMSNGPTERANNLRELAHRIAIGLTLFWNYRICTLPRAGKPTEDLLPVITQSSQWNQQGPRTAGSLPVHPNRHR